MNKELKQYLYMLVGRELTYESKEKILSYFNDLKQKNDRLNKKNKQLRQIINKTKEYIPKIIITGKSEHSFNEFAVDFQQTKEGKILLDILKGEKNERFNKRTRRND